jgi:hypothetical protein
MLRTGAIDTTGDLNLEMTLVAPAEEDDWADGESQAVALARFQAGGKPLPPGVRLEGPTAIVEFTLRLALREARGSGGYALSAEHEGALAHALAQCMHAPRAAYLAGGFSFSAGADPSARGGGADAEAEAAEEGEGPEANHHFVLAVFRCGEHIALARELAAVFSSAQAAGIAAHVSASLSVACPTLLHESQQPAVALLAAACKMEVVTVQDMRSMEAALGPQHASGARALRSALRHKTRDGNAGDAAERAGDYEAAVCIHYQCGRRRRRVAWLQLRRHMRSVCRSSIATPCRRALGAAPRTRAWPSAWWRWRWRRRSRPSGKQRSARTRLRWGA